ncbi:hypothetical protein [Ruegeria atlantica]|uniref:hypothetical protein n=1 Tax=Ruegeria atlantica TaxID=81569 RepID=UPI0024948221|nr:hypothetical protein [Ruegeria atlantica]
MTKKNDWHHTYLPTTAFAKFLDAIGYPEPQTSSFIDSICESDIHELDELAEKHPEILKKLLSRKSVDGKLSKDALRAYLAGIDMAKFVDTLVEHANSVTQEELEKIADENAEVSRRLKDM